MISLPCLRILFYLTLVGIPAYGQKPTAVHHAPDKWLVAGPWGGLAGFSLWGIDYEGKLSPNEDEPYLLSVFDSTSHDKWKTLQKSDATLFSFPLFQNDFMWSRGTVYAHLYLQSEQEMAAVMHLAQTGFKSRAWLNGTELQPTPDPSRKKLAITTPGESEREYIDKNDQGGTVSTRKANTETPTRWDLPLQKGSNQLLLKMNFQQAKGEVFSFSTELTDADGATLKGVTTAVNDPVPSKIPRPEISRIIPLIETNQPFNLHQEGEPLKLNVNFTTAKYFGGGETPVQSFPGTLELTVTDYDGKKIATRSASGNFPGDPASFDLGKTPGRGYYATHLRLLDSNGHLVRNFPPDGFSVIGGTSAQGKRKDAKKLAVTYYFMGKKDQYESVYFPYMKRMGIFRNIGGHASRALDLYRTAAEEGLFLTADLWTHDKADYVEEYVKETAPYVNSFKSYNEVDINHARGTPESWVKKAKLHFETVRKYAPDSLVVGGSFVRPASDGWFEGCLKLGLDKYHDVWDVHCYPRSAPPLGGSMANGGNETEKGILKVYEKLGMTNTKPFWIGETGARSTHGLDARRWQADMIAKMAACALSRQDFEKIGFLVPWWYTRSKLQETDPKFHHFDIEVGHMPGEAALYTASALIDGFTQYQELDYGPDIEAARFGPTLMIWNRRGPSVHQIHLPENEAYVQVDVVGRATPLPRTENGSVPLKVSESPLYILTKTNYDRLTKDD